MSVISSFIAAALMGVAAPQPQIFVPPARSAPTKSGTFVCRLSNRTGTSIFINGELGNWRILDNGKPVADIKLVGPVASGINAYGLGAMEPLEIEFTLYDSVRRDTVRGHMDIESGSEGRMSITHNVIGSSSSTRYVGFCDAQFSAEPREISK